MEVRPQREPPRNFLAFEKRITLAFISRGFLYSSLFSSREEISPIQVTGRFLTTDGGWTDVVNRARGFDDFLQAVAAMQRLHLRDAVIYYSFDEQEPSRYDFSVRVG